MFKWLAEKLGRKPQKWRQAHQLPGKRFPFPKGSKLRPEEEVVLAIPSSILSENEAIGSVFLFDDDVEIMLNDTVGAWYVKLKAGMTFSLAKSCEVMLVASDDRPRFFYVLPPAGVTAK